MKPNLVIIIPAHNEEAYLSQCLDSFVRQHRHPDLLLLVDDGSTDRTAAIASEFAREHTWIQVVHKPSEGGHHPGAKVVRCFQNGLKHLKEPFDFIGKFDADIVLPEDYFEKVLAAFAQDEKTGICSGLLYVPSGDKWVYEPIADKTHVRGPVKCYSAACFKAIGGLRESIGWDTADTLLAKYHGYRVQTLPELKVRHLRPTAQAYDRENTRKQGEALYKLRYGWMLGTLASLKMAWKRKNLSGPLENLKGALQARRSGVPPILSPDEGRFARRLRWQEIRRKLF